MQIEINELTVAYDDKVVLKDLTTTFSSDKLHCIMGESGKGKTTLLFAIMGLIKPRSGIIHGLEKKKISVVFQEERLLEENTVMDNIMFVLHKVDDTKKSEILAACNEVGLAGYENICVKELSGGMKRRVSILRSLLCDFDVLLLDEPLKGLDYDNKLRVSEYIRKQIATKKNETITIMVTHDKEEVDMMKGVVYQI